MSSSVPEGSDKAANKQGFTKVVKKVKTVLRRGSSFEGSSSGGADIRVESSIKDPAVTGPEIAPGG
jgi:hypothetical protein